LTGVWRFALVEDEFTELERIESAATALEPKLPGETTATQPDAPALPVRSRCPMYQ
jgi:hypothetical protein